MVEQQEMSFMTHDAVKTRAKCWLAVASADHVSVGFEQGFMQVCHGKRAPLARIKPNDLVAYYSPTFSFQGKDSCQSFTALGYVTSSDPYQVMMAEGFMPYRHNVHWLSGQHCPIRPLLAKLSFTRDESRWGYRFRFGLFEIPYQDMCLIAHEMGVARETISD